MFDHIKIQSLEDYFQPLSKRQEKGVYFYRINGYTDEIGSFIRSYYESARSAGVIIEGKLQNPDEKNLSYYSEIMGMEFQLSVGFIAAALKKWLPRMKDVQRENIAVSLYDSLDGMQKAGKTVNMLKNAYIKCMCWLYYKFERIVNQLGEETVPKILYEGEISRYELMILSVLSKSGCDIVLLQYRGDSGYLKLDKESVLSDALMVANMQEFDPAFSLKLLRGEMRKTAQRERMYGQLPRLRGCTNAWIEGKGLSDIKKSVPFRGNDPMLFYNCYCRIKGVEDKLTYANELYQFQLELKNSGRRIVIVNERMERPSMEEIAAIHRSSYTKTEQMIMDLLSNIKYTANIELQRIMVKAFVDVMLAEDENGQAEDAEKGSGRAGIQKLTNKAVYLLCWLNRYQGKLFSNWKASDIGCFIYLGGCRDESEALFLKFLARLPVDVLILCPQADAPCCLKDSLLYEIHYEDSLDLHSFPQENTDVHIATAAYHAERELDTLMYQDSGIYRSQQYAKANAVILQTMYEEIKILWKEELKYRPNFSTVDGVVNAPVIFAKVSGVKDGAVTEYWRAVKELITEDTFIIKQAPFIEPTAPNPIKAHVAEFYKNGRVRKDKIKNHPDYPYSFLREEMQDYILEKLQRLIDQKIIRGTFENGTEYTIVAVVLNLPKEIVRLIQKFDFTKTNPKLIYINTTEAMISLEDSILTAFLNLIGFDIVFFVPTGYQNIEKYFNRKIMEEHQIGQYLYDLQVPDLERLSFNTRPRWRDIIFKRGK